MTDYRQALESESERFDLPPRAFDRLFERQHRKERNKRARAALFVFTILIIGTWGAVSIFGVLTSDRQPASSPTPDPDRRLYQEIAGQYRVTLTATDPGVSVARLAGTYTMQLLPEGVVQLSAPVGALQEGTAPSGITYRLTGDRFTTNAFVNISCPGTVATYRWELVDGLLLFSPLKDSCGIRRTLFTARPWVLEGVATSP